MAEETNSESLEVKLKRYIESITKSMNVDQIILFGSYAKGNAHEYSDIDLAVISPDFDPSKSRFSNLRKMKEQAQLVEAGLQLLPFHTAVFEKENTVDSFFIREIKKTGKVIYSNGKKK